MSTEDVDSRVDDLGKKYLMKKKEVYSNVLYGFTATNVTKKDVLDLQKEEDVMLVERNRIIKLDPTNAQQVDVTIQAQGKLCDKQTVPENIRTVGWRNVENIRSYQNKNVFVIDTGLGKKLTQEFNINTSLAKSFVSKNKPQDWNDCHGHGTHVAGIIGAKDNNCGVVGIAAGISIVPLKVVGCMGQASLNKIIRALAYVYEVGKRGDVVNMSLGGEMAEQAMDLAVKKVAQKGIQFAIAAGNDNKNSIFYSPARVTANGVYTVCALSKSGRFASFSNFGQPPIDVCAPGQDIYSLAPNGILWKRTGTSMAAPHVAGLLALGNLKTGSTVRSPNDGKNYHKVRI
eukprot:CAMPEP_0172486252 /NCGR_PEP_ID=MMETSP1066-20121228/14753_1 /TAXON_ID=671091 /ORGANISM="Coscinodiscus wailesii, Strain CCMP2513" /LENGTH=343 /DNA_ID=CAMNT_0013252085 /DNA_START=288 /DNA_END=1319 /DNA_ORIENTATION=+